MALHLRPKHRSLTNPSLIHLFSTTPTDPNEQESQNPTSESQSQPQSSQSSFSSYFNDVKASLRQQSQQNQQQQSQPNLPPLRKPTQPSISFSKPTNKVPSLEEIRKNLSEFRRRSAVPPSSESSHASSSHSQPISFQELYKRNVIAKSNEPNVGIESGPAKGGKLSFESIRESLRQMRSNAGTGSERMGGEAMSLSVLRESLRLKPSNTVAEPKVIGGTEGLPVSVFGKEMRERKGGGEGNEEMMKTEFVKMYSTEELGEKLRKLRPKSKGEGWCTLEELNKRLMKLREIEEKETESRIGGVSFKDLRESLVRLKMSDEEKAKTSAIQRLDILGQMGGTPKFMLQPPNEHLVERYFHPDNMSSEEKMKIELAKVRDEFKMSESDCGSSRVQVAQLTTKIKHLSSVLHKKDKHSRKGLIAMVQRRKKLLKYLRRTDWDSYCLVLSKLGLRDNPDYKH